MTGRPDSGARALIRDYRRFAGWRLPAILALMLSGAVAEGFGILMLAPLVAVAVGNGEVPAILAPFFAPLLALPAASRLGVLLALFVAAMGARSFLIFFRDSALASLEAGYESSLRLRAAATLAGRGWTGASAVGQAGMQTLLLSDIPRAVRAVAQWQRMVTGLVMLAVQFAIAAALSWRLALVTALIVGGGYLVSSGWIRRGLRSGHAMAQSSESSNAAGFRLHAGLKAALAQGTAAQFLSGYRVMLDRTARESAIFGRDHAAARTLIAFGSALAAALLLLAGYSWLGLPFAVLLTLLVLFARMSGPGTQVQQAVQAIAAYAPSFARIEARVGPLAPPTSHDPQAEADTPLPWQMLTLDRVTFLHGEGGGVRNADLALAAGEWIGLAGPSGAGKTTLADIVAGLLAPQAGEVRVDGAPLTGDTLAHWRAGLAYVGQGDAMSDGSVRENLEAGRRVDDESLWQALAAVGLDPRIRAFADGLDHPLGDRGNRLSGGERQRLAIARALLRRPRLLILDEATAALDRAAEARLLAAIRDLEPRPALVMIAHRADSLEACDRVVAVAADPLDSAANGPR